MLRSCHLLRIRCSYFYSDSVSPVINKGNMFTESGILRLIRQQNRFMDNATGVGLAMLILSLFSFSSRW